MLITPCTCCNECENVKCLKVVVSGVSICPDSTCYSAHLGSDFKNTGVFDINGTFYAHLAVTDTGVCRCFYEFVIPGSSHSFTLYSSTDGTCTGGTTPGTSIEASIEIFLDGMNNVLYVGAGTINQSFTSCNGGPYSFSESITNNYSSCDQPIGIFNCGPECDEFNEVLDNGGTGTSGTVVVTIEPGNSADCSLCSGCSGANEPTCGNGCAPCTPTAIRAVVSGITVTTSCVIAGLNSFQLSTGTDPNRTIDLEQIGESCTWEATAACDRTLTRHDNTLCSSVQSTFNITSIRYTLTRAGSTSWTWEVAGYDGATKRVSFVGDDDGSCTFSSMSFTATANDCKNISTPTHPTRVACGNTSTNAGIFGSGGSTTFSVCPA